MPAVSATTCPRCGARLLQERDIYGVSSICIACGFARDIAMTTADFSSPAVLGREPHRGKGKRRMRL